MRTLGRYSARFLTPALALVLGACAGHDSRLSNRSVQYLGTGNTVIDPATKENLALKKSYWDGLEASPELVICFIPSEALVSSALEADPGLMDHAFSKKVALASPVTLWSVLNTVAFSWRQDVVTEDAQKIFTTGTELLQRLGAMAGHIETLGRSLTSSVKHYNSFVGSLESRVFPSARKLNELGTGADLGHALETVEELPREISAPELAEDESAKD